MEFKIYNQQEILSDTVLTDYILDTTIDNLLYIFGNDMDSEENRSLWIQNNLKSENSSWRIIIASSNNSNIGFFTYSIANRSLTVHDIEINKSHRFSPILFSGLFKTLFKEEGDKFDSITGYINKANRESQNNFLKLATSITEKPRGYSFLIDEKTTEKIKNKVLKKKSDSLKLSDSVLFHFHHSAQRVEYGYDHNADVAENSCPHICNTERGKNEYHTFDRK